jgi:hypothetical protein
MILDFQNLFSDAQGPITADAGSTNVIDLGAPGSVFSGRAQTRDIGPGTALEVFAIVDQAFDNLTSMVILLQTDDNSGFSSAATVWTSNAVLLASLVIGYQFKLPTIPWGTTERYLRLFYDLTGTAPTVGKITAGLVLSRQLNPTG